MVRQKSAVTYVEANGAFIYVWLQDNMECVTSLVTAINSSAVVLEREEERFVKTGSVLIAQATDKQYYRVRIIRSSFEFEHHYRCFFFDYGNFETVPLEKLFKLPASVSLKTYAQQTRCCMLDGIVAKTADNWPDNVMQSLSQRLVDREFFVEELGTCGAYPVVHLFESNNGVNIVDILANTGLGRRESAFGRWTSYIPQNPKLQSGSTVVVQIAEAESANDFSVTVDPTVIGVDLPTLLSATARAAKQPIVYPLLPHMLCLARLESSEGIAFYRAEVISVDSNIGVHLRLLDLGKKVILPAANLYVMPPDLLRLPPLSLHLCLGGLELASDDHSANSQLEWLRTLCFRRESVTVTILHALSPNFYAVVFNEMGIIGLSPLPYRLLPMLGQRSFELFLNRSLTPCSFNDPVFPAVLTSSLPSFDSLMAAFLSNLARGELTPLPPNAVRTGVFCLSFDESNEQAPYPVRCVILSPIMGSEMRCMLYEIDSGRQSVRAISSVYCAPPWAFAHPAFCVPIIAFDAKGHSVVPRAAPLQVRAIHREPVSTPAGIVVVQELIPNHVPTYEAAGRALHPVIEEVIIDDWDAETASESTVGTSEEAIETEIDEQVVPKPSVEELLRDAEPLITLGAVFQRQFEIMASRSAENLQFVASNVNLHRSRSDEIIDSSSPSVVAESSEFEEVTSYASPELGSGDSEHRPVLENSEVEKLQNGDEGFDEEEKYALLLQNVNPMQEKEITEDRQAESDQTPTEHGEAEETSNSDFTDTDKAIGDRFTEKAFGSEHLPVEKTTTAADFESKPEPIPTKETEETLTPEANHQQNEEPSWEELGNPTDEQTLEFADETYRETEASQESQKQLPVFSMVVEVEDSENVWPREAEATVPTISTQITTDDANEDELDQFEHLQSLSNNLSVYNRSSFETQRSVPARMLSENAVANQLLSPSCPFSILITPPSRLNSFDPTAAAGGASSEPIDIHAHISNTVEIEEDVQEFGGASPGDYGDTLSNTPPPSVASASIPISMISEFDQLRESTYSYPKALPTAANVKVSVSFVPQDVASSKRFWVRRLEDDYEPLRSEYVANFLAEQGDRLPFVLDDVDKSAIRTGFCCIAPGELNDGLFRVSVLSFVDDDHDLAKVLYVDHGNTAIHRVNSFKHCPREILSIPRTAHLCTSDSCEEALLSLEANGIRSINVHSYDEREHAHNVTVELPVAADLDRPDVNDRIGVELQYIITHVAGPNELYVKMPKSLCVDDEDETRTFNMLSKHLQEEYENTAPPSSAWRANDWTRNHYLAVAKAQDGLWKRAVILASEKELFDSVHYLVVFIDSGETDTIPVDRVRPFLLHRLFAIAPRVALIQISNFNELVVPIKLDNVGHVICLNLFGAHNEQGPLTQCIAQCCDRKFLTPEPSPVVEKTTLPLRALPEYSQDLTASTQRVVVTHFESLHSDFFVQLEKDVPLIEEIIEHLNLMNENADGSNSLRVIENPQIGQVCAGSFEGMLYRGEVISLDPLTVFYVDYGNTEDVSNILELPKDEPLLWGPPLSHRCRLLQTAKSLTEQPERIEEALHDSEAQVNLLFKEKCASDKPVSYLCEVVLPPVVDDSQDIAMLPIYPSLVDGVYSPTHLSEDGNIWLQAEETSVDLLKLESDLTEIDFDILSPLNQFTVGKVCLVSSRRAGEIGVYRGEITKVEPGSISVLQIDYGPVETYDFVDIQSKEVSLYSIPPSMVRKFLEPPRLALPCKLLDQTDQYRRLRLNDYPHVCYFAHFVQTVGGFSLPPFLVDLKPLEDRASTTTPGLFRPSFANTPGFRTPMIANQSMFTFPPVGNQQTTNANPPQTTQPAAPDSCNKLESGFADSVFDGPDSPFDSPAVKSNTAIFKPAYADGERFRGICVYVALGSDVSENSEVAFFHDEKRSAELDQLYDALSDVSRLAPVNFSDIHIGSLLAARFSEDGAWYRALVLSKPLNRDLGPTVYFIDYGNTEKINSCTSVDIRQLAPSLSPDRIKPMAIAVRPFVNPHIPVSMPVNYQVDETYNLDIVSSNSYLSGAFTAASRVPVLVANIVSLSPPSQPSVPPKTTAPVVPKQEPMPVTQSVPVSVQQVFSTFSAPQPAPVQQPKLEVKTEPGSKRICYSSAEIRKIKQTAPTSLNLTKLKISESSLPIFKSYSAVAEHFQHDNRLLLAPVTEPSSISNPVPQKCVSGGAFSVRPFTISQLPKTYSTKPFEALVVWTTDEVMFVQVSTDENNANLDLIDELTQKYGAAGNAQVAAEEPASSLLNRGCLAKWVEGDGRWYRAVIRNVVDAISKPPRVEVFFVDYGNTDNVPTTDLIMLPDQASLATNAEQRELLAVPAQSVPILKGAHSVKADDSVKITLEWRQLCIPPYTIKSLEK